MIAHRLDSAIIGACKRAIIARQTVAGSNSPASAHEVDVRLRSTSSLTHRAFPGFIVIARDAPHKLVLCKRLIFRSLYLLTTS